MVAAAAAQPEIPLQRAIYCVVYDREYYPPTSLFSMGCSPHGNRDALCYSASVNLLLLIVVLLLLFGGGGFYFGGPAIGGSGLGLVLLICLVLYLVGGFRPKSS